MAGEGGGEGTGVGGEGEAALDAGALQAFLALQLPQLLLRPVARPVVPVVPKLRPT